MAGSRSLIRVGTRMEFASSNRRMLRGRLEDSSPNMSHLTRLVGIGVRGSLLRLGALCMHGGGSPVATQMTIRQLAHLERKKDLARKLAGI